MECTQFQGEEAFKHLQVLAKEVGPRPGGSPAEKQAGEYIAGQMKSFGLDVSTDSFPVRTHEQKKTALWVLDGEPRRINAASQLFAANSPEGGVEGELAFVETAHPQYLEDRFRDKVWLLVGGLPMAYYEMAMRMRPRAIIAVENQMGVLPKRTHLRIPYRERYGSVPTVRIAYEDGMDLIKNKAKRVRVETRGEERDARSINVVGELPGSAEHHEIVVICAHLDSVRHVSGAGDNASGVSIMLELARALSASGSKRTLRFIAFGSEEFGLKGSIHYAKQLAARDAEARRDPDFRESFDRTELLAHRLCVNLDMHGVILGTNIARCLGPENLLAAVRLLSSEIGPAFARMGEELFSSDGLALGAVGIPGIAFARTGGSSVVTHSRADTIEFLDASHLEMLGRFIEIFLHRYVAKAFVFPFERRLPKRLDEKVQDYFRKRMAEDFPPAC